MSSTVPGASFRKLMISTRGFVWYSGSNAACDPRCVCQTCMLSILSVAAGCGEALEARVLTEEGQANGTDRTVPLLADDDLRDALVLRLGVVDLVAIDEDDDVGVLLDGARFAQVRHH